MALFDRFKDSIIRWWRPSYSPTSHTEAAVSHTETEDTIIGDFRILTGTRAQAMGQAEPTSEYRGQGVATYVDTAVTRTSWGRIDITIGIEVACRKHNEAKTLSMEATLPMPKHLVVLQAPCGCVADLCLISRDGGMGTFMLADKEFRLSVLNVQRGHQLTRKKEIVLASQNAGPFFTYANDTGDILFTPDGRTVIWGAWRDGFLLYWDAQTGRERLRLEGHTDHVECIAIAPHGQQFASGSSDGSIIVWDTESGRVVHRLAGQRGISTLAYSPDGRTLILGTRSDRRIRRYDPDGGKEVDPLNILNQEQCTWLLAFSPDGNQILNAAVPQGPDARGPAFVSVCDVATQTEIRRFSGGSSAAFSRDGRSVLVASSSETIIHLWQIDSGEEIQRFEGHRVEAPFSSSQMDSGVHCFAFLPDGNRMISGGADHTLRLWDVTNGREIACFKGHTGRVSHVAVAADGSLAISAGGGKDKSVRVWRLPPCVPPSVPSLLA